MSQIIAIVGQKGGPGKSTVAVCLAAYWHARKKRVLLVDADTQGSVLTWAAVAEEHGHAVPTVCGAGDSLRAQVPELAKDFDVTLIDLPGRGGRRQVGALFVADLAVLVSGPGTLDVWSLAESVELVREAQEARPELYAAVLLNKRACNGESRLARDRLAQAGLPVLAASLGQRVPFSEALGAGQGVTAYAPQSAAAEELIAVAKEIEALLRRQQRRGLHAV